MIRNKSSLDKVITQSKRRKDHAKEVNKEFAGPKKGIDRLVNMCGKEQAELQDWIDRGGR